MHICLEVTGGDLVEAAKMYGVKRNNFTALIKKYGFDLDTYRVLPTESKYMPHITNNKDSSLSAQLLEIVYKELMRCHWNRTLCAKRLGVSTRSMQNYVRVLKESGYKIHKNPLSNYADEKETQENNEK